MKKRWLTLSIIIVLLVIAGIYTTTTHAPESTEVDIAETTRERLTCLTDSDDNCLVMPAVSGVTVDNVAITFPEAFTDDYHLVVMPFDREQQVLAVTWLPLFQDLAAEHETVQYWSIAALPELNIAVRLLVIGGMSAGISEEDVRKQVTVLFLQEQADFLEALAIESDEDIQAFIMDSEGVVYHREIGEFSEEKGDNIRAALANLSN